MSTIAGHAAHEYRFTIAGRTLRVLGPASPLGMRPDDRLRESRRDDAYMPYWAQPWPVAIALADYLLAPPRRIVDPVLEIGAGLGITGLALALFGHRVVISDYDEDALAFIQASALLNDVRLDEVKLLDWRDPPADHFPTIVAADCAYTRAAQPAIAALLATCLSPGGSGYFSDMNRRGADSFVDAVRDATLDCLTTPITCKPIPRADAIDKRTLKARIFHITRRGSTPNGAEADQGQRVDSNGQPPSSGGGGGSHLVR